MKNYKEKTASELERIEYFKKNIIEIALAEGNNFRSIEHRTFYDYKLSNTPLPGKGYTFKDLLSEDDMKLYIIAWKQVLPEIEKAIIDKKKSIKQHMRDKNYENMPEHCSNGLEYLYKFRFAIRVHFRRKNGYRKPLTSEQKKLISHYESMMTNYAHRSDQERALKELLKTLEQRDNYWLFIIAYKNVIHDIEKSRRNMKEMCRKKKRTYFNPNVTLLYTLRNIMRERAHNMEGKTK